MKEELRKRLPKVSDELINYIVLVIEKYDLKITVNEFDQYGLLLKDKGGKSVRVVRGEARYDSKTIHLPNPRSDIVIIFFEGILAGWIESDKLEDLQDRFSIGIKNLNPMPETFQFKQTCEHISVHGGFYDGENWECAGCGMYLVYKE